MTIQIQEAEATDAPTIARILRAAFDHNLPYLPQLHTPEEDLVFIRDTVFQKCSVYVAKDPVQIVGFCAFRKGWIDHLYILPDHQGQGIGPMLLNTAKNLYSDFQLWTFQKNDRARAFYESHGFVAVEFTDGEGNEEKEPDVRFWWQETLP